MNPQTKESSEFRARAAWIFWLLLAGALLARLTGLFHGLPYTYDEQEQRLVNLALKIGATHTLDTQFVIKGILPWILLAEYGAYYLAGRAVGLFSSTVDFAKSYFVDASAFYVIDRLNQAVVAILCVWFIYRLGRKVLGESGGLWAMALAAFSASHIAISRYAAVDIYNALFATLALTVIVDYDRAPNLRRVLWAAFWCSASAAAKLTGGVMLMGLLAVALSHRRYAHVLLAGLIFWVGFFVLSPSLWVNPLWNFRMLLNEMTLRSAMSADRGFFALGTLALEVLSVPGLILFVCGLAHPLGGRRIKWLGMLLPLAVTFAFVQRTATSTCHYYLIVWPVLFLVTASGLLSIRRAAIRWTLGAAVIASQLLFLPGSMDELLHPMLARPSGCEEYKAAVGIQTRVYAMQPVVSQTIHVLEPVCTYQMIAWIKSNLQRGTRLALMEGGTWKNRLLPVPEQVRERLARFENVDAKYVMDYNLGNKEMYKWVLRFVEEDTSILAYHLTYLDIRTTDELMTVAQRRWTMMEVEGIRPYETWSDVSKLDAEYLLLIYWPSEHADRYESVKSQLEQIGPPVAVYPPFMLYRLPAMEEGVPMVGEGVRVRR